jgi:hypothetical protein
MTDIIVTYCSRCEGEKNHDSLFIKKINSDFDDSKEEYSIVECKGCNNVSFLKIVIPKKKSEKPIHYNYPHGYLDSIGYYDFLSDDHREDLPNIIYNLYEEIIHAFEGDASILAGIGLRTLVEAVCIDQKISGANLQKKIEGLYQKGLISSTELPILDKLRIIGNVSAHEIKSLSMEKLELALGIVNHILRSVYTLPKLNKKLNL